MNHFLDEIRTLKLKINDLNRENDELKRYQHMYNNKKQSTSTISDKSSNDTVNIYPDRDSFDENEDENDHETEHESSEKPRHERPRSRSLSKSSNGSPNVDPDILARIKTQVFPLRRDGICGSKFE